MVRFSAVVQTRGTNLSLDIPEAAGQELLPFADRGRIRITGRLNGAEFSATLMPVRPRGHVLYLPGGLRAATGVRAGDTVAVDVLPQLAHQAAAPGDLATAFNDVPGAAEAWERLAVPHRGQLIRFIGDARSTTARVRRVDQVVAQLLGAKALPPGRRTGRALWTCPTCGQQFVTRNMNHSCAVHSADEPFEGKPPGIRRLFELICRSIEMVGPVTLVPYRDHVAFMVRVRFAGARPTNKWLDVNFWLTRRVESPRFRRIETLTPYTHIHTLRVLEPSDVDAELAAWLREAYAVGCQEHLRAKVERGEEPGHRATQVPLAGEPFQFGP